MRTVFLLLCIALLSAPVAAAQNTSPFTAHIERFSNGWIDWDKGLIYASGRAYTDNNNGSSTKAMAAAQLVAAANIVKLASGLQLDDRRTMEKLGNGNFTLKLQGFLRYREHERQYESHAQRPYAEITLVTPLHGVEGLTAHLLQHLKKMPLQWQKFPLPGPANTDLDPEAPWLVIDSRNLPAGSTVQPSLFPKVTTTSGQTLYDLNQVNQAAHSQRGMARYVHSRASVEELLLALQPATPSWWQRLSPVSTAWAQPRQKRPSYIVTSAVQVQGMARTNLVISASDAQRLREEDAASRILKNCRVIIITSAPIGGIEGKAGQRSLFL